MKHSKFFNENPKKCDNEWKSHNYYEKVTENQEINNFFKNPKGTVRKFRIFSEKNMKKKVNIVKGTVEKSQTIF